MSSQPMNFQLHNFVSAQKGQQNFKTPQNPKVVDKKKKAAAGHLKGTQQQSMLYRLHQ